mmetsp:Transcript_10637/g.15958  ORF Transcript_10637/g.15958 Transcript_10637/m.15958 type:complete len:352 (-) Transcript_10637:53-1108(-)
MRSTLFQQVCRFSTGKASTPQILGFDKFGRAEEVLKLQNDTTSSAKLNKGQVRVKMIASPVNPFDLSRIAGWIPGSSAPGVGGSEGVGEVVEVGGSASSVQVGEKVVFNRITPTWRHQVVVDETQVSAMPSALSGNVDYAAVLSLSASTAFRLISDFGKLKKGDVIIQNAANSTVGQTVLQLAKEKGITTINVVRNRPESADTIERMKAYGADIVVEDSYVRTPQFKRLISDLPAPKLALDATGGPSATELARNLAQGGTMVSYGGMSRQPVQIPNSLLLFNDITVRGFSLDQWLNNNPQKEQARMLTHLAQLVGDKALRFWIEKHRFVDFQSAIAKSREQNDRKVVLAFD